MRLGLLACTGVVDSDHPYSVKRYEMEDLLFSTLELAIDLREKLIRKHFDVIMVAKLVVIGVVMGCALIVPLNAKARASGDPAAFFEAALSQPDLHVYDSATLHSLLVFSIQGY